MNHKKKLAVKCIEQLETQQEPSTSSQCLNITILSFISEFIFGHLGQMMAASQLQNVFLLCVDDGSILPPPRATLNTLGIYFKFD
jgi:anti-anti-sigma regulatory factor